MENCKIQGRSYSFPVTKTRDRDGWHQTGELLTGRRDRVDFYPLREGLQDAYLKFVMEEALRTGEEKYTCRQSWAE